MNKAAILIFPHQLFEPKVIKDLLKAGDIFLLEEPLFFDDGVYPQTFHQQKLVLHRATMKYYQQRLQAQGLSCEYLEFKSLRHTGFLREVLQAKKYHVIHCVDVCDDVLKKRIVQLASECHCQLVWHNSPQFLLTAEEAVAELSAHKRLSHASFYKQQRLRFGVLVSESGQPMGGQWSFDPENRKKLPRKLAVPVYTTYSSAFLSEAQAYVKAEFSHHPGEMGPMLAPLTHEQALTALKQFLADKLAAFGPYEDALTQRESTLFHSVLSPALNSGLLLPSQVVDETLTFAQQHEVPLASLEGFLRQVMGWREYIRGVYLLHGSKQRRMNHFLHQGQLPAKFWQAETGLLPLDTVLKKVQQTAYAHHIERLMVIGNFMLLTEVHPDEVYRWFLVQFLDAYDWVMVPNVYGMSQGSDGGMMMTKPYFSAARYLLNMSDYPPGPWVEVWNGLYWRFIAKHQAAFAQHPRMVFATKLWQRMSVADQTAHQRRADEFLHSFYS